MNYVSYCLQHLSAAYCCPKRKYLCSINWSTSRFVVDAIENWCAGSTTLVSHLSLWKVTGILTSSYILFFSCHTRNKGKCITEWNVLQISITWLLCQTSNKLRQSLKNYRSVLWDSFHFSFHRMRLKNYQWTLAYRVTGMFPLEYFSYSEQ